MFQWLILSTNVSDLHLQEVFAIAVVRLCPCVYLLRMFFTCNACWDLVLERVAMLIKEMLC